jgi:hypothetical protein
MQLRHIIRHGITAPSTVATVAVAAPQYVGTPEEWPALVGDRWPVPRRILEGLLAAGVISEALALGWDARELVGVSRSPPHEAPNVAGLIFSMREGETVRGLTTRHCVIAAANVRHIWQRTPLTDSICLPWELLP